MAEIQFDNVDSILSQFSELSHPRSHVNRIHAFGELIVICIMAVISGADGPQAIGTRAQRGMVEEAFEVAKRHHFARYAGTFAWGSQIFFFGVEPVNTFVRLQVGLSQQVANITWRNRIDDLA